MYTIHTGVVYPGTPEADYHRNHTKQKVLRYTATTLDPLMNEHKKQRILLTTRCKHEPTIFRLPGVLPRAGLHQLTERSANMSKTFTWGYFRARKLAPRFASYATESKSAAASVLNPLQKHNSTERSTNIAGERHEKPSDTEPYNSHTQQAVRHDSRKYMTLSFHLSTHK